MHKLLAMFVLVLFGGGVLAQDIEPRAYSNAPVGVNFLVAGYAYSKGGISFDPSLPLTNAKLRIHNTALAYVRSLDLWGRSGIVDIVCQ